MPLEGQPRLLVGICPSEDSNVTVSSQTVPCLCSEGQERLRGTLRHSPPHRQFLIQRCSHCFTAVVSLGDFSMVTQPHLGNQELLTLPSQVPAQLGEVVCPEPLACPSQV